MSLNSKSLTELRAIAQGMGIAFGFGDDKNTLARRIEGAMPQAAPEPVPPVQVVTVLEPGHTLTEALLRAALAQHISRGVALEMQPDHWVLRRGKKMDTGSLDMPIRSVVECANRVLK